MTQKEFDNEMHRISDAWAAEKHLYVITIEQINEEKRKLLDEKDELNRKLRNLKNQLGENCRKVKEINIKYHDMKHQLCVDNPKDSMTD